MANTNKSLKELYTPPDVAEQFCIEYPFSVDFCLEIDLIHLLPKFHGLENEDPYKHLKEFHLICSVTRPQGITEEEIKLRAFPFSLADRAKDWLFYLPPRSITTWTGMVEKFLDKFFPFSHAINIAREIFEVKQRDTETLHEYQERFNQLCAKCPQHGISDKVLIECFNEGQRKMMDATDSQQFEFRQDTSLRRVNEVNSSSLEKKIENLISLVQQIDTVNMHPAKVRGICATTSQPTNTCSTLQEAGGFFGPPQKNYDLYSNTYSAERRDHPNFSYGPRLQFHAPPPQGPGDDRLAQIEFRLASLERDLAFFFEFGFPPPPR